MQDLRQARAHARALAGRTHDSAAGSGTHSLARSILGKPFAGRRHNAFSSPRKRPGFRIVAQSLLIFPNDSLGFPTTWLRRPTNRPARPRPTRPARRVHRRLDFSRKTP